MKRVFAHIISSAITIYALLTAKVIYNNIFYTFWAVQVAIMNIVVVYFAIISLKNDVKDINTKTGVFILALCSAIMPFFVSYFARFGKCPDINILKEIGIVVDCISMIWYIWAVFTLRKNMTILPEATNLVTTGIYKYSRHPLYSVYILWCITQIMIFQTIIAVVFSIVQILLFIFRAKKEEDVLMATFDEYVEYKKNVKWIGRRK